MINLLVVVHRYLGLVFGLLVLLWCLSGFVMMFVQYPSLKDTERLSLLPHLEWQDSCCSLPKLEDFSAVPLQMFRIQMRPNGPQLELVAGGGSYWLDLETGEYLWESTSEERQAWAQRLAQTQSLGPARWLGTWDLNQWSIIPSVAVHAPYDVFELADKTHLYLSVESGQLVQQVTFNERTWGWVGAVVHWLYPTVIRQNAELWVQLVIWLSIISLFLVVVGFWLGLARLRNNGAWTLRRFRGRYLWHHYAGLGAGVLMLTWLFSGLLSMYPWGMLEGRNFAAEQQRLQGGELAFDQALRDLILNLPQLELPQDTREITGLQVAGFVQVSAVNAAGQTSLLLRRSRPGHASDFPTVQQLAQLVRPTTPLKDARVLHAADAYYYSHHIDRPFPVLRLRYEDGEHWYHDPQTMALRAAFDSDRKATRWFFNGLHSGDFLDSLRQRPFWYLYWGGLLAIMTFAVGTGFWMGIRRWQILFRRR